LLALFPWHTRLGIKQVMDALQSHPTGLPTSRNDALDPEDIVSLSPFPQHLSKPPLDEIELNVSFHTHSHSPDTLVVALGRPVGVRVVAMPGFVLRLGIGKKAGFRPGFRPGST